MRREIFNWQSSSDFLPLRRPVRNPSSSSKKGKSKKGQKGGLCSLQTKRPLVGDLVRKRIKISISFTSLYYSQVISIFFKLGLFSFLISFPCVYFGFTTSTGYSILHKFVSNLIALFSSCFESSVRLLK